MSLFKGASRSLVRVTARRALPVRDSRRAASSMTAESQQRVRAIIGPRPAFTDQLLLQLLSADLEHADPAVYDILQHVRVPPRLKLRSYVLTCMIGEEEAEALHQPHSLRELHVTGSSRCPRKCYAKWGVHSYMVEES